ncbi:MAG: UDP-N-acetylmuramate dehydrogenase, partial [Planctomycetota bacterium]
VAAALAIGLGADPSTVGRSLSAFEGLARRMQRLGERPIGDGVVRVYDDYGHHPTELDTTIRAVRAHERTDDSAGRLIVVFQPHQHSRTRFLLEEFATSFAAADVVIVPHIYFVRDSEAEKQRVSSADLVDRLRARGVRAMHLYPFEAIVEQLENLCRPGDTLLVMGAGPVWNVAHDFLRLPTHPTEATSLQPGEPTSSTPSKPGRPVPRSVKDIPIKTWFRVGGNADRLATPESLAELASLLAIEPNARVLGDGANLLVDDDGVDGLVIDLRSPAFRTVEIDPESGRVVAGAGARLPSLIGKTVKAGLAGIEGLAGIPASLGGATVMNAGGRFGEIADVISRVHVVTRNGAPRTLERTDIAFDYRTSGALADCIVTSVELALTPSDEREVKARYRACSAAKEQSQPLADKSAGCCFKNPVLTRTIDGVGGPGERVSAGRLIDLAECKGLRTGSAEVSMKHANFITADKAGKARHVITLMDEVQRRVHAAFGVHLVREVVVWSRNPEHNVSQTDTHGTDP